MAAEPTAAADLASRLGIRCIGFRLGAPPRESDVRLTPDDVAPDGSIVTMWRGEEDGARSTKNEESVCRVYVPSCIRAEILEAAKRNAKRPLLFAIIGEDMSRRVGALGKRIEYLQRNVCKITGKGLAQYSFRHRIVNLLRVHLVQVGMMKENADAHVVIESQIGHAMPRGYGDPLGPDVLGPILEALPLLGAP